jgi:hypothetical protein
LPQFSPEHFVFSSPVQKLESRIYKTVILPVVLYGCGAWSLTLREEHRLRVFENRVLRRIFGPKRDEVTGEWRKLHNEEGFRDLYGFVQPLTEMSTRNRKIMFLGSRARPASNADSLVAICEPII